MKDVEVVHWAEFYRDGRKSIRQELQARIDDAYIEVHRDPFKNSSSCLYPQTITLPSGLFWVDGTIYLPPSVSFCGEHSKGTCLQFESFRNNFILKGDQFLRIKEPSYLTSTRDRAVCIAGIGNANPITNPNMDLHRSQEREISNLTIHARGDASAIVLFGRETNALLHNLHLHGYGGEDGCAIAASFPADMPRALVALSGHPWKAVDQHDWATNLNVHDIFCEGFMDGILTTCGDGTFYANQFWDLSGHAYNIRNSTHLNFGGPHVFTRVKGWCYHITQPLKERRWEGAFPYWRTDSVDEDDNLRDRYIKFDGNQREKSFTAKWGGDIVTPT